MLGSSEEIEVIKALFAASSDVDVVIDGTSPWQLFLMRLASLTRAQTSSLNFKHDGASIQWSIGNSARAIPTPPRNNRVYSQIDFAGDDAQPLRTLKVAINAQSSAVLTIWRDHDDFRAVATSQLSALSPYIGQALVTWSALATERETAALTQKLAKKRGLGWVSIDLTGRVLRQDINARAMLRDLKTISIGAGGNLNFHDTSTAQNFSHALRAVQANAPTKPISLCENPRLEMILTKPDDSATVIGCLQQEPKATSLPVKSLAKYLDLSPSETRMAALLCDGNSIKAAADQLGWTIETAKSCSKQIYARAGVNGQTGLLRKVLNGAIWVA